MPTKFRIPIKEPRSLRRPAQRSALQRHLNTLLAVVGGLLIILALQYLPTLTESGPSPVDTVELSGHETPPAPANTLENAARAAVPVVDSLITFPEELLPLLHNGQQERLRQALMQMAANAAGQQDDRTMGNALTLLGVSALQDDDTEAAAVYLAEALAIYNEIGDELGGANANLQLGRLHVLERRRARRAALAYDAGLLARWHIARGRFDEAATSLHNAIDENLVLRRFGAAARDLRTLASGYLDAGQWDEATEAATEAARLYASSGRLDVASAIIESVRQSGISIDPEFNSQLQQLNESYRESVEEMGRARDYNQLYHQLIAQGEPVRAWQFRMQANASLERASKRARYRRQAGVLVLLYNSNDNMDKAKHALRSANEVFMANSMSSMAEQSLQLMHEVY